jgi:hypothetical protein
MTHLWNNRFFAISALIVGTGMGAGMSVAAEDQEQFQTRLTGFQETPAILTNGRGTFRASLHAGGNSLSFTLTYSGLSTPATAAHIHIGQSAVAGGVIAFLCGGGGKPACPAGGGTVTGTITASDIMAVPAQGVEVGNFANLVRVLLAGVGYANVHSTAHPGGEIRGQIRGDD